VHFIVNDKCKVIFTVQKRRLLLMEIALNFTHFCRFKGRNESSLKVNSTTLI